MAIGEGQETLQQLQQEHQAIQDAEILLVREGFIQGWPDRTAQELDALLERDREVLQQFAKIVEPDCFSN